jgi:hypothetical protein
MACATVTALDDAWQVNSTLSSYRCRHSSSCGGHGSCGGRQSRRVGGGLRELDGLSHVPRLAAEARADLPPIRDRAYDAPEVARGLGTPGPDRFVRGRVAPHERIRDKDKACAAWSWTGGQQGSEE